MPKLQFHLGKLLIVILLLVVAFAYLLVPKPYYISILSDEKPGIVTIRSRDGRTLVHNDEFLSVDWNTQTYRLTKGTENKINNASNQTRAVPFDLFVDEDLIYSGQITHKASARATDGPTIACLPLIMGVPDDTISIDWGYPAYKKAPEVQDCRFHQRILRSLSQSNKLKRYGG